MSEPVQIFGLCVKNSQNATMDTINDRLDFHNINHTHGACQMKRFLCFQCHEFNRFYHHPSNFKMAYLLSSSIFSVFLMAEANANDVGVRTFFKSSFRSLFGFTFVQLECSIPSHRSFESPSRLTKP